MLHLPLESADLCDHDCDHDCAPHVCSENPQIVSVVQLDVN